MIDNSKEYVLCAAYWYKIEDEKLSPRGFIAQNISTGIVIGQFRHCNVIHNFRKATGIRTCEAEVDYVDGFLTSKGNFVDRIQASEIAYNAGQITKEQAFNKFWNGKYKTALGDEPKERWKNGKDYKFKPIYSEDLY